jgi:uncharacterized damage-inducible protein DinB
LLANKPSDTPIFVQEFHGQIDFVNGRLMQLAEAMPGDIYDWTPGEGVRTVGEVYVHIAQSNYYLLSILTEDTFDGNEDSWNSDKEESVALMSKSFEVVKEKTAKFTEEDLNREVEAFGYKFSVRNFMITLLNHAHEHLGQSIAYARMNGVTPPWSMQE